ncbi:hypothetical protein GEMRC1_012542 [Eukaryota sp. GEM-RC1]
MELLRELQRVFQCLNDIAPEGTTTTYLSERNPASDETANKFRAHFTTKDCCEHFLHWDIIADEYSLIKRGDFPVHSSLEQPDFLDRVNYGIYALEDNFYDYQECMDFRRIHGESGYRNPIVAYSLALVNNYGILSKAPISEDYSKVIRSVILRLKRLKNTPRVRSADMVRADKFLKLLTNTRKESCIEYGLTDERCRGLFNLYNDIYEVSSQSKYVKRYAKALVEKGHISEFFEKHFGVEFSKDAQQFLAVFMLAYVPVIEKSSSSYLEFAKTLDEVKNGSQHRINVPNVKLLRPGKFIGGFDWNRKLVQEINKFIITKIIKGNSHSLLSL